MLNNLRQMTNAEKSALDDTCVCRVFETRLSWVVVLLVGSDEIFSIAPKHVKYPSLERNKSTTSSVWSLLDSSAYSIEAFSPPLSSSESSKPAPEAPIYDLFSLHVSSKNRICFIKNNIRLFVRAWIPKPDIAKIRQVFTQRVLKAKAKCNHPRPPVIFYLHNHLLYKLLSPHFQADFKFMGHFSQAPVIELTTKYFPV